MADRKWNPTAGAEPIVGRPYLLRLDEGLLDPAFVGRFDGRAWIDDAANAPVDALYYCEIPDFDAPDQGHGS